MADPQQHNAREFPEYEQGRSYFKTGMSMAASDQCPHPIGGGSSFSDRRLAWMLGFFDAYFQSICDRHNWGNWLAKAVPA